MICDAMQYRQGPNFSRVKILWWMDCCKVLREVGRFLGGVLVGVGAMSSSVWSAPESIPQWPSEQELVVAMQKGVKSPSTPSETISIRSMHAVNVDKNENAFLVSVWLPSRGRNFSSGTFLYRPKLKQARELDYSLSLGVQYVTGYYNDFVLLEQYGSGQGSEDFTHAIVRFSGWKPLVLHTASFGNNLGTCGSLSTSFKACEQTSIKFQMLAGSVNSKDTVALIETTTRFVGDDFAKGKPTTRSRRMRLKGERFVAVKI